LVIIRVVTAPTSALPERIEDGKDAMIYDSIKTYRIQLDPEGTMPNVDVGVRVDGRDIPDARVNFVAIIFVDRVVTEFVKSWRQAAPYILRYKPCAPN
jgi:hypothetical protein